MHASSRLAALVAAAALVISAPASAQVFRPDPGLPASSTLFTTVRFGSGPRFRGGFGHGGFRHGGFGHRGFGHRGFGGFHRGGLGYRSGFGYGRGYGYRRGFGYGHGYGYRRGLGAGVAGLAAGALIGGAVAAPAYGYTGYGAPVAAVPNVAAYCAQRFRSYDPATGTYTGYDGLKHPCP